MEDIMKKIHLYGNWKMNMLPDEAEAFCGEILHAASGNIYNKESVDICLFPPFISIAPVVRLLPENGILSAGAQDGWIEDRGAFTGAVSMDMVRSTGCTRVLVGHSERRSIFGDTDEIIGRKLKQAFIKGLKPVLCFGETLEQRETGETLAVLQRQLVSAWKEIEPGEAGSMLLAYEPVWAIGTGRNAQPEDAQEACAFSRNLFRERFGSDRNCPVLYGGSVKESNAAELLSQEDIDGALVGGASLKVPSFLGIYENYRNTAQ
jgi:triosephosphate isomerase